MEAHTDAGSFGSLGAVIGLLPSAATETLPSICANSDVQEVVPDWAHDSCAGKLSSADSLKSCPTTASGMLSTARNFCDRELEAACETILKALGHTCAAAGLVTLTALVCIDKL